MASKAMVMQAKPALVDFCGDCRAVCITRMATEIVATLSRRIRRRNPAFDFQLMAAKRGLRRWLDKNRRGYKAACERQSNKAALSNVHDDRVLPVRVWKERHSEAARDMRQRRREHGEQRHGAYQHGELFPA
jgi:hypothetical protein